MRTKPPGALDDPKGIRQFWRGTLARDADAMSRWFQPDAAVYWYCTNEKFTVDEFIRASCEYPGERDGRLERAERFGERIITVPHVLSRDGALSFRVVSWIRLKDGLIHSFEEYWADDGEAPQPRKALRIGTPIRRPAVGN